MMAKCLRVSIVSRSKIYLKQDSQGLCITVDPSIGEIPGNINLHFLDTRKDEGMIEINFSDPHPYISVYESDGKSIYVGFGTPLTEGVKASLELTAEQAEEFIRDIQRQLDKRKGS